MPATKNSGIKIAHIHITPQNKLHTIIDANDGRCRTSVVESMTLPSAPARRTVVVLRTGRTGAPAARRRAARETGRRHLASGTATGWTRAVELDGWAACRGSETPRSA